MSGEKAGDLLTKSNKSSFWSNSALQNGADMLTKANSHLSPDICLAKKLLTC